MNEFSVAHQSSSNDWSDLDLSQSHVDHLRASGIAVHVARERGYCTLETKASIRRYGFSDTQSATAPAMLIPQFSPGGELSGYVFRSDKPRLDEKGKPIKYESKRGARLGLDCSPAGRQWVLNPDFPILITEGTKKVDAATSHEVACVSIPGVSSWRTPEAIAGFDLIPWKDRDVYTAFDSDHDRNPQVRKELQRLIRALQQRGAATHVISIPEAILGVKIGLDDYFAAGGTYLDLLRCATTVEASSAEDDEESGADQLYFVRDGGLAHRRSAETTTQLTNFDAQIVADIVLDDGIERQRQFEIETSLNGKHHRFHISVERFNGMNWPTEQLGHRAVIFPGQSTRDHARAAIQLLSKDAVQRVTYTHTGWREIDSVPHFLTSTGAIGPAGLHGGVSVSLPDVLGKFALPAPPVGNELTRSVASSLDLLEVGLLEVTAPIYASIWRAAIGDATFSLHVAGGTGIGKTEIAALCQQHLGSEMNAQNLPASWSSTANALERIAFSAKDVLMTVDDFAPTGSSHDVARFHRDADRLLRAVGNRSARQRMRRDEEVNSSKPPRALILSTGEDVPKGQSLRARVFVVEPEAQDTRWDLITTCQRHAAEGTFAAAMSGFVQWLARDYKQCRDRFRDLALHYRDQANLSSAHRRTPVITGELMAAFSIFTSFAVEAGALTATQSEALKERVWKAIGRAARRQSGIQGASEPTQQYRDYLASAISSGRAHIADPNGDCPQEPKRWGWNRTDDHGWRPNGDRIGWVNGDDLYLNQTSAFAVVQRLANQSGDSFPLTPSTLNKRLNERKLLKSTEKSRGTLTVRRTVAGQQQSVLHVSTDFLASAWSLSRST